MNILVKDKTNNHTFTICQKKHKKKENTSNKQNILPKNILIKRNDSILVEIKQCKKKKSSLNT